MALKTKFSFVSDYLIQSTTCAYLKTKRTNLRSSGRSTIGFIYVFKGGLYTCTWFVHSVAMCVWNVLEGSRDKGHVIGQSCDLSMSPCLVIRSHVIGSHVT